MHMKYQGSTKGKRVQLHALRHEFEVLGMKDNESVEEDIARTPTITNKMIVQGEKLEQTIIIEKMLRSMTTKFNYVVCPIKESNDAIILFIDDLHSSLFVHEQMMMINQEKKGRTCVENHKLWSWWWQPSRQGTWWILWSWERKAK